MSITDVRVQVPPRAPRSTGGLPSGGTPQRGSDGSKSSYDARVVELADSLDSGSNRYTYSAGSSPALAHHKNNHTCGCGYFYGNRENLKCSAEVNSACAKIFACGENACTAQKRRRPEGRLGGFPTTVLSIQNIDFNRPFQKERFAFRMSFLEFRPPLAASAPAALTFPPLPVCFS